MRWQVCEGNRPSQLKIKERKAQDRERGRGLGDSDWLQPTDRAGGRPTRTQGSEWKCWKKKHLRHTESGRMKVKLLLRGWFTNNKEKKKGEETCPSPLPFQLWLWLSKKCHDYSIPWPRALMHPCTHVFWMALPCIFCLLAQGFATHRERHAETYYTHTHTCLVISLR